MSDMGAVWLHCGRWINEALDHSGNTHSLADVARLVAADEARLWVGKHSALVTEINNFPRARVLSLWLAGGDLNELTNDLRPAAEAWGFAQGCTRSAILGRDGWVRALRGSGYEPAARLVMKDLTA